jgi:hypothetical protein
MSTTICRAKNKATCRVHGVSNPMNVILNSVYAALNLNDAKKACDLASNLEELSEAKQLLAHDQKVYDSTAKGREELRDQMRKQNTFAEELELKRRLDESLAYGKEILENNPVLKESYTGFNNLVHDAAKESYVFDGTDSSYEDAYLGLKDVPYGTSVAIKTLSGSLIYDRAGDGLVPEANHRNFWNKLSRKGFVHTFNERSNHALVSLKNSSYSVPFQEIAEIHVLRGDHFVLRGIEDELKLTGSKVKSEDDKKEPSVWTVEGSDYYYQVHGSSSSTLESEVEKGLISNVWEEGSTGGVKLVPYKPKTIQRINVNI